MQMGGSALREVICNFEKMLSVQQKLSISHFMFTSNVQNHPFNNKSYSLFLLLLIKQFFDSKCYSWGFGVLLLLHW